MTVGISTVCQGGHSVIVASDRMITDRRIPIEYESTAPKFSPFELDELPFVFASAGSALTPGTLTKTVAENIEDAGSIEDIARIVKLSFLAIRREKYEDTVLQPRGFDLNEFYEQGIFDSNRGRELDQRIDQFSLNLKIIVAGVDQTGAHTFRIVDPQDQEVSGVMESFDELGFDAIGSGANLARDALTSWYDRDLDIDEALYVTVSALERASQAPGVGDEADAVIITPDGMETVDESLLNAYRQEVTQETSGLSIPDDLPDLDG